MTEHDTGGTPMDQLHELLLESTDSTCFLDALTAAERDASAALDHKDTAVATPMSLL